ncbi:glycosyltransferase family 2 protein [Tropicimonas isoalkanivorans]|uniref:Glycosyl transferase family 2 n=1 Tax=Tropicimonas isoalkanivorans TaxID=441112 RepID=A0A1I1GDF4_9RHOB|nr:glycosyltransferase family A protein [Tropicimonas isoalkanivorans]SFC09495.1 Glycosyl transferase family 2 [Tropicimonas isoalkanivorans]
MPKASIVVPAYNVAATLAETLRALLRQTFDDYEIVLVDDGSTDATAAIAAPFEGARFRIVSQSNRGLAGARNSGIAAARGDYIGFCDSDDLWHPAKLERHVRHLDSRPDVGVSFSGSAMIDETGKPLGLSQRPMLRGIDAAHIFRRNPVGNGSAPVIRRAALDAIAWRPAGEYTRDWWFDETFRQSEDIECWLRMALTTDWSFEGIPGDLTLYRINSGGLSASTEAQLRAWERLVEKLSPLAPGFFARHTPAARAYQLRYLCRRAISDGDATAAGRLAKHSLLSSRRPLWEEPAKSATTLAAALVLGGLGSDRFHSLRAALGKRGLPTNETS